MASLPATTTVVPRPAPSPAGVDALVDATPASRDRVVGALRGLSIVVVVLWHWVLSITHWSRSGALTMPNPIDTVPGLWAGTWVLQIMPVFFVVGGYANLAAWDAVRSRGATWPGYARKRVDRLLKPIAAFLLVWAVLDVAIRTLRPGTPSVWTWGRVVFVPLWFLGAYLAVVLLAPATAWLHRRSAGGGLAGLAATVVALDLARFHLGWTAAGYANSLLVWVFAHQLGFWWRDGRALAWSRARHAAVAATGLLALVALTASGTYSRSMVAVRGEHVSNMFPTTACIAALAVFQFGLVLLARPALERLLARRRVWKATVSLNAVAMTVFTWHMTALVAAIGIWRALGFDLLARPTGAWWAQRPIWLLLPGLVLAGLLAVFARIELPPSVRRRR
ncbi:acyltransferase [Aquihabitans sp. G128]|uniref:acyltransferase family protein n=1 Tax=Aquihabitans sp. G128 TaxID=2849779 RepID=UPI001C24223B|nr:acyltransferase [Aquihabitans sp. G128]QXC59867.1 acyltransferase [Aquihabitans sp. G128]